MGRQIGRGRETKQEYRQRNRVKRSTQGHACIRCLEHLITTALHTLGHSLALTFIHTLRHAFTRFFMHMLTHSWTLTLSHTCTYTHIFLHTHTRS